MKNILSKSHPKSEIIIAHYRSPLAENIFKNSMYKEEESIVLQVVEYIDERVIIEVVAKKNYEGKKLRIDNKKEDFERIQSVEKDRMLPLDKSEGW
ncbi:MAG: hypothetical protein GY782_06505 [Gammaproteobacteria bacterium]|nr:hypothetical protein [Gammaproteobacteria bacterium]